jgi:transposase
VRTARSLEKVVTLANGRVRRFRTTQQRCAIVEETLQPGASVALVARAHNINSNQLFKWRRQYRKGELEVPQQSKLLPVKVVSEPVGAKHARRRNPNSNPQRGGIIDIDLGHARIRIEGAADVDCVRSAIESLWR